MKASGTNTATSTSAMATIGPDTSGMARYVASRGGRRGWWRWRRRLRATPEELPAAGNAEAMFVVRDNVRHMDDIERHYRMAIRAAKKRIVIANAYFFPGYRFIKDLKQAARRGVDVRLILQGEPDMPFVKTAASMLYHHLLRSGVRIYEYCQRPLHGKVALVDDEWSTVGSSNLDPMSLVFNLEANVIIRDREFTGTLAGNLERLMCNACNEITLDGLGELEGWPMLRSFLAYHFTRYYPRWARWLPRHVPRLLPPAPNPGKPLAPGCARAKDNGRGGASGRGGPGPSGHWSQPSSSPSPGCWCAMRAPWTGAR